MQARTIAAGALMVIGTSALGYGAFSYAEAAHPAAVGPIHLSVSDKESVNVPVWVGAGAIVLMLVSRRRS